MKHPPFQNERVLRVLKLISARAELDDAATALAHQTILSHTARPTEESLSYAFRDAVLPVATTTGNLLYALARAADCRTIVEVGTSHGASTLYLAAALQDNGGGKVHSFEIDSQKILRAQKNVAAAGLDDFVKLHEGNAAKLIPLHMSKGIDLLFLDSWQDRYCDLLVMTEPLLRRNALVVADDVHPVLSQDYITYISGSSYFPVIMSPEGSGVIVSLKLDDD